MFLDISGGFFYAKDNTSLNYNTPLSPRYQLR